MSIYELTGDNFVIQNNKLNTNIRDISVVLFKQEKCKTCIKFLPIYKQLAKQHDDIHFCTIDVQKNPQVVGMSRRTKTVLNSTPVIIVYNKGDAFSLYDRELTPKSFNHYLSSMKQKIAEINAQPPPQQGRFMPVMEPQQQNQHPAHHRQEYQDDDDDRLLTPDGVTPWNTPWETSNK